MNRRIHKLFVPLVFPAGIAPGEGSHYNRLRIARNGVEQPVLRGTALAGALRHAWSRHLGRQGLPPKGIKAQVARFFGEALSQDAEASGVESRLQVGDCVLDIGSSALAVRTHHLRNRHTGVVADGGLFSLEVCPPETVAALTLWLRDDADSPDEAIDFLKILAGLLQSGLTLGGNSARGIGFVRVQPPMVYRAFDLTQAEGCTAWLDDHRAWRAAPSDVPKGEAFQPGEIADSILQVDFTLGIPRGQDLLVGDGQGMNCEIEPQRIIAADGQAYWRLPGASLRGLFRGWVNRLAARQDRPVADHVQRQQRVWRGELFSKTDEMTGDNLGWCFLPKEQRRHKAASTDCPVAALFGTLFHSGRIFISDAYAHCSSDATNQMPKEEQRRTHVAVDRITGGAAESMLFENTVLTAYANGTSPQFPVTIRIEAATEQEGRWLAKTLRALDLGLLRVGSSKSSGRLALLEPPRATGKWAELFHAVQPGAARGTA
jgi:CRISPR/Cas system CSM-associated protein Csm3 (group 7 of RAMP superfamily)